MSSFERMHITLPPYYANFVKECVKNGTHASRSEVIRHALMAYIEELVKRRAYRWATKAAEAAEVNKNDND